MRKRLLSLLCAVSLLLTLLPTSVFAVTDGVNGTEDTNTPSITITGEESIEYTGSAVTAGKD